VKVKQNVPMRNDPKVFVDFFRVLGWTSTRLADRIVAELTSGHRHYHGVGHHALMLQKIRNLGQSHFYRELLAATFFHDLVYDASRTDNERKSADIALDLLGRYDFDLDFIVDAVLATQEHKLFVPTTPRETAIQHFLRADLMILWSDEARYRWYADGIRKEYAHVPNDLYRVGRPRVLDRLGAELHPHLNEAEQAALGCNIAWEKAELFAGTFDV
jgi:predicted metal-dependent HD superfamily phosphohydrolase